MMERIEELRAEGEAAIAAATSAAQLEDLRVRLLGRKAELPQLLRGVRDLSPEERGPVGQAANEARAALEALLEARDAQRAASSRTSSPAWASTSPRGPRSRPSITTSTLSTTRPTTRRASGPTRSTSP